MWNTHRGKYPQNIRSTPDIQYIDRFRTLSVEGGTCLTFLPVVNFSYMLHGHFLWKNIMKKLWKILFPCTAMSVFKKLAIFFRKIGPSCLKKVAYKKTVLRLYGMYWNRYEQKINLLGIMFRNSYNDCVNILTLFRSWVVFSTSFWTKLVKKLA